MLRPIAIFSAALALTGCATMLHGSTERVTIASVPPGAIVTLPGGGQAVTPATVHLSRRTASTVTVSAPGYAPQRITFTPTAHHILEATLGNWWNGFLPGAVFDYATGSVNGFDNPSASAILQPAR